jgi:hypothetical protein
MLNIFIILISLSSIASPEKAQKLLDKYASESNRLKRLDLFSKVFLGLPYGKGGPLGEGPEGRYDQDPLYRFDTFDCTTYVETVLSLALTKDVTNFEKTMNEVRYENGVVDYLTRNHFPSLQWIPNNVRNGLLKEIGPSLFPSLLETAEAIINLPGWLKSIQLDEIRVPQASHEERVHLLEELRSMSSSYSPMIARLPFLPIKTILSRPALLSRIPHGSIVNFVRPNWDLRHMIGTHMNVSHQGYLFRKGKVLYLRHASTTGEVMEVSFLAYLKKFENHPTLKGVHFMGLR